MSDINLKVITNLFKYIILTTEYPLPIIKKAREIKFTGFLIKIKFYPTLVTFAA